MPGRTSLSASAQHTNTGFVFNESKARMLFINISVLKSKPPFETIFRKLLKTKPLRNFEELL